MVTLAYEIRESADAAGGLRLELIVEGHRIARAVAAADMLDAMAQELGLDRQAVTDELRRALEDLLKNQLDKAYVSDPIEDAARPLRFRASYTYRDHDNVSAGLVWYDVNSSDTGPTDAPAIVRNKLRTAVHRKLTVEGSAARALVDLHG